MTVDAHLTEPARPRPSAGPPPEGQCGHGAAFGCFGELLQGVLPREDRAFLVTFPIDGWSRARFRRAEATDGFTVRPAGKTKSLTLAKLVAASVGYRGGGQLELTSDLPEGKGLASSSADLVATARATAAGLGLALGAADVAAFLREIEPSDGVMYDGIVAFYHREVTLRAALGYLPPMAVIGHDRGGLVDTVAFNQVPMRFSAAEKDEYGKLLDRISGAVRDQDIAEVAATATRSAELWLARHPDGRLESMRRACAEVDGLGLVLTHSGTMIGILLADDEPELAGKADYVKSVVPGNISTFRSLGGASAFTAGQRARG